MTSQNWNFGNCKKKIPKFNCQVPLEGTFSCRCYFQKKRTNDRNKNVSIYEICVVILLSSGVQLPCHPFRSSHRRCSVRIGVLKNFVKFTRKHLYQSLFFKNTFFTEHLRANAYAFLSLFNTILTFQSDEITSERSSSFKI